MFINKILPILPNNLLLFIITLLLLFPLTTIYYVFKFYLFTVKLSIRHLQKRHHGPILPIFNHQAT